MFCIRITSIFHLVFGCSRPETPYATPSVTIAKKNRKPCSARTSRTFDPMIQQIVRHGQGKPETFTFLGFTHICGRNREGKFVVIRKTMRTRLQAKLKEVYQELKRRMHDPVPEQGVYLRSVVGGHIRYYGVPRNGPSLSVFRTEVGRLWWLLLKRRNQKHRMTLDRIERLVARWLPPLSVSALILLSTLASLHEARTVCGKTACTGLCGGRWVTSVPTAIRDCGGLWRVTAGSTRNSDDDFAAP